MTAAKNKSSENTSDREIIITRTFDAPREMVWDAWTDPEQVVKWWGPKGFSTTIDKMDVKVGGVWKHVMHGPDGVDYPNKSIFIEIVKPERIVYSHDGGKKGDPGANFEATWTFEALEPGKTKVIGRMVFPTAEARDRVVKVYNAIEGGNQHLGRLGEYLKSRNKGESKNIGRKYIFKRTCNATRELVWQAWTDPKHVAQWWGPKGFTNPVCEIDARPGGAILIHMRGPDGAIYPMTGLFKELVKLERLVFTAVAIDDKGAPHLENLNTVTFTEKNGKTTLILEVQVIKATSLGDQFLQGIEQGWSQSLDRLADLVQ